MKNSPLLTLDNVHSYYGNSHILKGINLEVNEGEITILAGRHGVGKTTTLLTIMGVLKTRQGTITFKNKIISEKNSWNIAQLGLGLIPENRCLFPFLTVQENLEVAQKNLNNDNYNLEKVWHDFPELLPLCRQLACYLSGGQQQMLAIARTLVNNPQLILMDEPIEGLAPLLVARVIEILKLLKERNKTILITGQNLEFAYGLADSIYILDQGIIQWSGKQEKLKQDKGVWEKYLTI